MVLTTEDDKWKQDKINTAYMMLENCIATTKQKETVQPFYNLSYVGDLSSFSVQCPPPIRTETLWATNLCDNTVVPVGKICSNGNVVIDSCVNKTCSPSTFIFCDEYRVMNVCSDSSLEDHFVIRDCPTLATFENCVWSGSNRQYAERMAVSHLCTTTWQRDIMKYSIDKRVCCCSYDIEHATEMLSVCVECYNCWELPYPCFTCCTFCNVFMKQIDSQYLIYCTPDGTSSSNDEYKCMVSHNPGTQNCNYECNITIPFCYIGWNTYPYCYGGEEKCCFWNGADERTSGTWNIIVPCNPLAVVCRVIDVYTVQGASEYNTNPIYAINMNILCGGK